MPEFDAFWFLIGIIAGASFFAVARRGKREREKEQAALQVALTQGLNEPEDISVRPRKTTCIPVRHFVYEVSREPFDTYAEKKLAGEIVHELRTQYPGSIRSKESGRTTSESFECNSQIEYRPSTVPQSVGYIRSDREELQTWATIREHADVVKDMSVVLNNSKGFVVSIDIEYLADDDDDEPAWPSGHIVGWKITAREVETREDFEDLYGEDDARLAYLMMHQRPLE